MYLICLKYDNYHNEIELPPYITHGICDSWSSIGVNLREGVATLCLELIHRMHNSVMPREIPAWRKKCCILFLSLASIGVGILAKFEAWVRCVILFFVCIYCYLRGDYSAARSELAHIGLGIWNMGHAAYTLWKLVTSGKEITYKHPWR